MSPSPRKLPRILLAALVLLGSYELFLRWTGVQAEYAESNLQANLMRISTYRFQPVPENLILGSSLSGRLLPKFFEKHGQRFGNLALDGSGVPMGLEIFLTREARPKRLFLEANTLFFRSPTNEQTLREAIQNPVFQLGRFFYFVRPGSRPSAQIYSFLKKIREANEAGIPGRPPADAAENAEAIPRKDLQPLKEIQADKMQVFLVVIPSGRGEAMPGPALQEAVKEIGAAWMVPRNHLPHKGQELRFTDGLHLDRASAEKIAVVLMEVIGKGNALPETAPGGSAPYRGAREE